MTAFTFDDYSRLIDRTREAYRCVGFEVLDGEPLPSRFAIIRHDIDMSPIAALELAQIEANVGVRATYTVLLNGEYYNPFERATRETLREIASLGHDLGLHFDADWHGIEALDELERAISWDRAVLEHVIGDQIKMFSFHNTTPFTMGCKSPRYAGLRNAYAGILQDQVEYTSDSNGYWIHRSWDDIVDEGCARIQVLTHPEWWGPDEAEPAERVTRAVSARSLTIWSNYRRALAQMGRENRSGLIDAPRVLPRALGNDGEKLLMLWLDGRQAEACLGLYMCIRRLRSTVGEEYRDTCEKIVSGEGAFSSENLRDCFEGMARELEIGA